VDQRRQEKQRLARGIICELIAGAIENVISWGQPVDQRRQEKQRLTRGIICELVASAIENVISWGQEINKNGHFSTRTIYRKLVFRSCQ
jgi:hypothetical protein